jgi:DNA topoisomerase-2
MAKNIRETYRSHTHEEHIYEVPDTYIGSAEEDTLPCLVVSEDRSHFTTEELKIVPGLYKVFDEVLVNSLDQHTRLSDKKVDHPMKQIRVNANKETGEISVWNDGMGIDVAEHPDQKSWVPEMIFGKLLTSTNYDKGEKRFTGGKNGYGAKLANIFAKQFTVETVDSVRQKKYKQTWKDNMKTVGKPKITSCKSKPYTKITWVPDYARFGVSGLTDGMYKVIERRAFDCAAWCGASVKVKWNDDVIPCRNILHYSKMVANDRSLVQLKGNEHWEVFVCASDSGFSHVSFVNGIHTGNGGKHVIHAAKQITDAIVNAMKKKIKKTLRAAIVRDSLCLIVKAKIINPSFLSQTKDELTTPVSKMGTKWSLDPKDTARILSGTSIMERLMEAQGAQEDKDAKKTDGKKKSRITGIPKLEDATKAGTRDSSSCTLILTEGDSAATTAISGLKVIGRDQYGVFPLKGKMINTKNSSTGSVNANTEIQSIKKILGLVSGKKYTDVSSLRYGKVMIMTDQDHDGSHIKGLVMNMFHSEWPELLKLGYVVSMLTPIVKAFSKKASVSSKEISFYTLYDYEQWREEKGDTAKNYTIKYYKGLGTSTAKEAREYFKSLRGIHYDWDSLSSCELDKAFLKGKESDRKTWISEYDPSDILKYSDAGSNTFTHVPIPDFINKELIAYSHASTIRAIPNLMDGMKTSQRKILYGCFKKNLRKEIRVAQLAGYVSEHSAYHHGEASLNQTIVGMAQTFVGSNNINLLEPCGQFGSRLQGGKDSASPRYIHTCLSDIAMKIFRKEDQPVLKYLDDDGILVEPEWYAPVIPMILVNGGDGIATGYSTNIPSYNPSMIVSAIRSILNKDEDPVPIGMPWWRGFTGTIKNDGTNYLVKGVVDIINSKTVVIKELPVGTWTKVYREFLEKSLNGSPLCKKVLFSDIKDEYNDLDVKFTIDFMPGVLDKLVKKGSLYKTLGLESKVHTTNMWLFDADNRLRKFDTPEEILNAYVSARIRVYEQRRENELNRLAQEHERANAKAEFIRLVCENVLDIRSWDDKKLSAELKKHSFPCLSDVIESDPLSGWKYLMNMPVRTLTPAQRKKLLDECDEIMRAIEITRASTPKTMWLSDLDEFESAYKSFLKERKDADTEMRNEVQLSEPKKIVRRRRKKVITTA